MRPRALLCIPEPAPHAGGGRAGKPSLTGLCTTPPKATNREKLTRDGPATRVTFLRPPGPHPHPAPYTHCSGDSLTLGFGNSRYASRISVLHCLNSPQPRTCSSPPQCSLCDSHIWVHHAGLGLRRLLRRSTTPMSPAANRRLVHTLGTHAAIRAHASTIPSRTLSHRRRVAASRGRSDKTSITKRVFQTHPPSQATELS